MDRTGGSVKVGRVVAPLDRSRIAGSDGVAPVDERLGRWRQWYAARQQL